MHYRATACAAQASLLRPLNGSVSPVRCVSTVRRTSTVRSACLVEGQQILQGNVRLDRVRGREDEAPSGSQDRDPVPHLVGYVVLGPEGQRLLRVDGAVSLHGSQFGSAIAQELGALSLDYVSVQQGGAAQALGEGGLVGADTQVELGRYVGDDLFLIMVLRPFDTGPQDQNTVAGIRVEWALTDDYNSEFFFEDRFLRSSTQLLGSSSGLLESQRVLGVLLFREWGYGAGSDPPDR